MSEFVIKALIIILMILGIIGFISKQCTTRNEAAKLISELADSKKKLEVAKSVRDKAVKELKLVRGN